MRTRQHGQELRRIGAVGDLASPDLIRQASQVGRLIDIAACGQEANGAPAALDPFERVAQGALAAPANSREDLWNQGSAAGADQVEAAVGRGAQHDVRAGLQAAKGRLEALQRKVWVVAPHDDRHLGRAQSVRQRVVQALAETRSSLTPAESRIRGGRLPFAERPDQNALEAPGLHPAPEIRGERPLESGGLLGR